uniref:PH domain-containing protein n=1 Tax=Pyramimonas obovata TaxID=1411642 RepID=A0A7S0MXT0_9CHLO|mmetsp:Transcript_14498/g.31020  ORF Transcript_14498/g.31020 Transcript_14498/m.31020 type:complete len:129 (+) Transcript_14498:190-576(+)
MDPAKVGEGVRFWENPERVGWLMKQGAWIKTWRRRWFVMKDGLIFWFKTDKVTQSSVPRGIVQVNKCLSVKGAEEVLNKPFSFEISTRENTQYFVADSDKEKEDWINAVGRAIVRQSASMQQEEVYSY